MGNELAGWIILLIIVFVVIFLASRSQARGEYEFVGLAPLIPGEMGIRYLGSSERSSDLPLAASDRLAEMAAEALKEEQSESTEDSIDTFLAERKSRTGAAERSGSKMEKSLPPEISEPEMSGETNEESVTLKTPLPFKGNGQASRKEEVCRQVLEEIYGLPFPKVRPNFLRNPDTGRNLELDGYCHQTRVGFEFNGSQHYVYPNNYHKNSQEFMRQVRRDNYKYKLCKQLGIHLIVVPHDVPADQIREFIKYQLPRKGRRGAVYVNPKRY